MKITLNNTILPLILVFVATVSSCVRDQIGTATECEVVITASATLPSSRTKMIYEDSYPESGGIKAGWVTGDTFLALEINGETVTPVTFKATASKDIKATFTSTGAVAATPDTRWVAVLGKGASFADGGLCCSYTGQRGTLEGLEGFDYMVTSAIGESPDFDYSKGKQLTYALRMVLPEGVENIEFNTGISDSEWHISKDGVVTPCSVDSRPKAVRTVKMPSPSSLEQIAYLAVPAVDYTDAGLIVTVFNKDGSKSQGKVLSKDLTSLGGRIGTFTFDALIDRPLPSEAIDFISQLKSNLQYVNNDSWSVINDVYSFSNSPKWSPFNVGASSAPTTAEEVYGSYFAWGETEQKSSYSEDSYRLSGKEGSIGRVREYRGDSYTALDLHTISGTKYDAARVKWGSAWRMPFLEEMLSLVGSNESQSVTAGVSSAMPSGIITEDVTSFNGIAINGRLFKLNGRTLFLPYAGRYYYTESAAETPSMVGKAGCYFTGAHNCAPGSKESYRLQIRNNQVDVSSQTSAFAFSIRPVLSGETDEAPEPTVVRGLVTDSSTGMGIAGVVVSDGFNCVKTSDDGSYVLYANSTARTINLTIPSSYEIPLGTDGRPEFFRYVNLISGAEETVDFHLTPRSRQNDRFTLIAVSDAHVKNESNLAQFKQAMNDIRNTVGELEESGTAGEIIGVALGDQLWDNMAMAEDVRAEYCNISSSGTGLPFFFVIGNHDHEAGTRSGDYGSTANFVRNFGPLNYSFDIGNAHIVVMDNIYDTDNDGAGSGNATIGYKTKITGEQLNWLRQDIENVSGKSGKIAIFCAHAPLYQSIGNGEAIKILLNNFRESHIFSGHIHNLTNYYHTGMKAVGGRTLIEHNIQSLCGMWWLADLSPNGTPAGYGVYTFGTAGLVSEYNKVTKEDSAFQMRVYDGNDIYNGYTEGSGVESPKKNTNYEWDNSYKGKFLVRLWDGDDPRAKDDDLSWVLTFEQNGKSVPMTRLTGAMVDKCSAAYIVDILGSPYGTGGTATSYSWWMIDAPGGSPAAEKGWIIKAKHYLPGGWEKVYSATSLTKNFLGYPCGSRFEYSYNSDGPEKGNGIVSPSIIEDNATL